jgi:hypothetical protein
MTKQHHLFLVPGLGDATRLVEMCSGPLKRKGIITHIVSFGFMDKHATLDQQLKRFNKKVIDIAKKKKNTVSLLGISAGGSAMILAWQLLRKQKIPIHRIINVCGRLEKGTSRLSPLEFSARKSRIFYDSVTKVEPVVNKLSSQDRKHILTFRGLFDEIVPVSTIPLKGATNKVVLAIGHQLSIGMTLLFYSRTIVRFIKNAD